MKQLEIMTNDEIVEFAKEFTIGILDNRESSKGMCFAVCLPLYSLLGFMGINCHMEECEVTKGDDVYGHCFIEFDDKTILDPTADQFNDILNINMPRTYLGEKPKHYKEVTE